MNRRDFTKNIASLTLDMIKAGDQPVEDMALRSQPEQKRLFDAKLTKCDGTILISGHQKGTAKDIYFCFKDVYGNTQIDFACKRTGDMHAKWHKVWVEKYGGKPMLDWDKNHYEG